MATNSGYDPKKAATFNKLRQQGLSEDAALSQAGIGIVDINNYALGTNGQLGALVVGTGTKPGVEVVQQVEYAQKANAPVSRKTPTNYTSTSTETVSGGGSTTITAGAKQSTPASQALQPAIDAKQAEIDQFNRDNPSNFVRKKQGLPPLSEEENQKRSEQSLALSQQKSELANQQLEEEAPGEPTITTEPNTTTTTQTVTTGTTSVNNQVQSPGGDDPAVNQQTEVNLGSTIGASNIASVPGTVETNPLALGEGEEVVTTNSAQTTEDPFEAARLAAEERANQDPPTLTAADVPPLTDEEAAALEQQQAANREVLARQATEVEPGPGTGTTNRGLPYDDDGNLNPGFTLDEEGNPVFVGGDFVEPSTQASANDSRQAAAKNRAQQQSTLQARVNQPAAADWRVRLQLAKSANYLYRAADAGILKPLFDTDGVIFPYTPTIETSYKAKYDAADLVHSNYKGYFYKSSAIEELSIRGTFTAQDSKEAQYLLAVIHFFRSATKMFYGKDEQAGAPPPLVFLSAYGQYQFNRHPCVISNFSYSLPADVDYVRANGFNNYGLNMENRRTRSSGPSPSGLVDFVKDKLKINNLFPGGLPQVPAPGAVNQNVSNTNSTNSTYVPTKMEISISLLPIQTRSQVSQQFSLKGFANGDLLKGGFW
jgi:hypothetical protein